MGTQNIFWKETGFLYIKSSGPFLFLTSLAAVKFFLTLSSECVRVCVVLTMLHVQEQTDTCTKTAGEVISLGVAVVRATGCLFAGVLGIQNHQLLVCVCVCVL